uniref:TLC domain-containing protein n=1 Tax=Angiostrongylus cantonensis TaxID=6313 RepID=A0A0K0D4G0_ANGCA
MQKVLFCASVSALLRLEYLLAVAVLNALKPDWSQSKVYSPFILIYQLVPKLFSLLSDPNYFKDSYDYKTDSAQYVFLFTMVWTLQVITVFSIILITGKLFGFAMIGLLVEVQTIFLHLRTMVRLAGHSKRGTPAYDFLINANMICLFLFRHIPATYLLNAMLFKDEKTPLVLRSVLIGGLGFLTYHNIHLTVGSYSLQNFHRRAQK